ncbi:uncharacterized protein LOC118267095 [Spodoptera frugiperda]|uniref:Uncharacterized protein LOC118267095 n=1 Tax=Spodoptera frugiperda TaxID=7108 RepID=A0A9R0D1G1_SPOFR|nr:uncharacterized protein LOC118267095 [Spodoptera frugiperda]
MEININNAFKEAIKVTCGPCVEKYRVLTEINQKIWIQVINYLLKKPVLSTVLFSIFLILFSFILSAVFIILLGVFILATIVLLFEGFVFIVLVTGISMVLASISLVIMIIAGVKYNESIINHLD